MLVSCVWLDGVVEEEVGGLESSTDGGIVHYRRRIICGSPIEL